MTTNVAEEIKSRLDIIEVISEYVDLKKAGSTYKALCPFHAEKTPSFTVSPSKQIFHCFGCGAGGDMFAFVMKYDSVSFTEAVSVLAKKAGIELKGFGSRKTGSANETLYRLHADATEFFISQLESTPDALAYFSKRGIDRDAIKEFRLGYAPQKRDALFRFLRGRGYQESVMESAGVVKFSEGKKPYDMFRDRIIFPIADAQGRVIAFGARILGKAAGDMPKYINSPETPIFKKGSTLYGLDVAREHIRKKGYAIISEGYTDVISFHRYGFRNAVAPLGTALTEGHLRQLRAYAKKVLLVFDGDEAGLKAARRAFPLMYESGLRAKVLLLPEGHDPDTYLREKGPRELQRLYPQSRDIVDFYLGLGEDRVEIVRELIGVAARMKDAILRGQVVTEIAQKTAIPALYLVEEIQKVMKSEKNAGTDQKQKRALSPEETLIAIGFLMPGRGGMILSRLDERDFEQETARTVFLKAQRNGEFPVLDRMSSLYDGDEVSYITALTVNPGFDEAEVDTIVDDCLRKMRARVVRRSIEDMEMRIKIAEASGDISQLDSLLSRKQAVIKGAQNEGIL